MSIAMMATPKRIPSAPLPVGGRRHGALREPQATGHGAAAVVRSLREPTRFDSTQDDPEAHPWQARRRLRRPEGWQCATGERSEDRGGDLPAGTRRTLPVRRPHLLFPACGGKIPVWRAAFRWSPRTFDSNPHNRSKPRCGWATPK